MNWQIVLLKRNHILVSFLRATEEKNTTCIDVGTDRCIGSAEVKLLYTFFLKENLKCTTKSA